MTRIKERPREAAALERIYVRRGAFRLTIGDFGVPQGSITCIVGPNGSGKTTLLLTLLGLLPHDGVCRIGGERFDGTQAEIKVRIGYIPDDPELLFEELTAEEQWSVTAAVAARVRGGSREAYLTRAAALSSVLAFKPPAALARDYSHGMRKKTQIVNALLTKPDVVVVDELRNGLDPVAILKAEELMRLEKARGAAVIAATHDLWWAERFADHICVLHNGQLVRHGTLKQLLEGKERHLEDAFMRIIGEEV